MIKKGVLYKEVQGIGRKVQGNKKNTVKQSINPQLSFCSIGGFVFSTVNREP